TMSGVDQAEVAIWLKARSLNKAVKADQSSRQGQGLTSMIKKNSDKHEVDKVARSD
ncbi:hypothetical protein ACLOJK_004739, partial [Asimina triloba]